MSLIDVSNSQSIPRTTDDSPLDPNCLHCQLALPIQHFIAKHPEKSYEDLIREACESVAELVAATGDWAVAVTYREAVMDYMPMIIRAKWESLQAYQRNKV